MIMQALFYHLNTYKLSSLVQANTLRFDIPSNLSVLYFKNYDQKTAYMSNQDNSPMHY